MYFPFQVSTITKIVAPSKHLQVGFMELFLANVFLVVGTKEDYMTPALHMAIMVFHGAVHLLMIKEFILMIQ